MFTLINVIFFILQASCLKVNSSTIPSPLMHNFDAHLYYYLFKRYLFIHICSHA